MCSKEILVRFELTTFQLTYELPSLSLDHSSMAYEPFKYLINTISINILHDMNYAKLLDQ